MPHHRQLIRDAVVEILRGETAAGTRVTSTRVTSYRRHEVPAISVYTLNETVSEDSRSTSPRRLRRDLALVIAGWVNAGAEDDADDGMDDLAGEIETAMHADPYLGDLVADSILRSTDMTVRSEGDAQMGLVTLTYSILYDTLAPEPPSELDDFLTAEATWNLGNAVHEDDRPEDIVHVQWSEGGITVPRDGPANWYRPTTVDHFDQLLLAIPDFLFLCAETSGDLVAAIGTRTLVPAGTGHLYGVTVAGWASKFVEIAAGSGNRWSALDSLALGQSFAVIAIAAYEAAGAANQIIHHGSIDGIRTASASGGPRSVHGAVNFDSAVVHEGITTAHQLCWYRNATANLSGFRSELTTIAATHNEAAIASTQFGLGAAGATTAANARFNWYAGFVGANAERDFDAYLLTLRGA